MGCCGRSSIKGNTVRTVRTSTAGQSFGRSSAVWGNTSALSDIPPVTVTDDLLYRWSRIMRIAKLLPVFNEVRALEQKLRAVSCRSCKSVNTAVDKTSLGRARLALGTCAEETAKLVKEAANILKYRVTYRVLSEQPTEIIR